MKRAFKMLLTTAAVACLTVTAASAQQAATLAYASKLDSKTRGTNIRVSQLLGLNIQNSQGESVGEIKDIVLDTKTGKVRYAAVTYGGFLGVGNKMFAVPFAAFKVQVDPDEVGDDDIDEDDYVMVLDVIQQQLDGQHGFDEERTRHMAIPQVVSKENANVGEMGQQYLATGKEVALRRWEESVGHMTESTERDYETVGYLLSGRLEQELRNESVKLEAGDSWLVPAGAAHRYQIREDIVAIEATSPPARFNDRDEPTADMQS